MGGDRSQKPEKEPAQEESQAGSSGVGDLQAIVDIISGIDESSSDRVSASRIGSKIVLKQEPFGEEAPPSTRDSGLQKAQDLVSEAWNASGARRVELAQKALEVSKDCADAYVILAEETARSLNSAKELYEEGVRAGERALGPKTFEDLVGDFWTAQETRPYMRARAGLAQCLWSLGQREEAIGHCADMLRLNPSDNQGIRYALANWLLHEGLYEDLKSLLDAYEGDLAATWLYTKALWAFASEGPSETANDYLEKALDQNPFVPSYLLGLKKLPGILPEHVEIGDEREAISYIAEALNTWLKTEGSLEWLVLNLPRSWQKPEARKG